MFGVIVPLPFVVQKPPKLLSGTALNVAAAFEQTVCGAETVTDGPVETFT